LITSYSILEDHEAVVISVSGHVTQDEAHEMRSRILAIIEKTGFSRFVMDISELLSIEQGSTFAAFELGRNFRESGFPLQSKTAVILPVDPKAREQAKFLHTVQINRGRGELKYVNSIDDGLFWFRSTAN